MKRFSGYNVVVLGVSYFDGMASSTRVRNLIEPLVEKRLISVFNLIYTMEYKGEKTAKSGTANGIDFRVIEFQPSNIFSIIPFLYKGMISIKKNKSKQFKNILYNYDYPDAKNIFFLLFAKLIGYKIVFDVVEDYSFFKHYTGLWNWFRVTTSRLLIKVSPYIADSYIAISSHLYKKMHSLAGNKVPVSLIPVSVNFKYFTNGTHRYNHGEVKIFYGGSFGAKDGLPYLINAFDELCTRYNNIRLVLTGKGLAADMENIFAKISKLESKDKVVYKGYLNTDNYYKLLNDCDIFCMTRINSKFANAGFPFKLGEFLATGKGVIATNVGDIPSYLTNKQNALLIQPESTVQLVEAVTYFLQSPDKVAELGAESRKTAKQYFDSEKLSMQLLEIFKST